VPAGDAKQAEDFEVEAVAQYLPTLVSADWAQLRAGRLVYESGCAPCHGAYGRSDTAVAHWLNVGDLIVARERLSDAAIGRISQNGIGTMPALRSTFDPGEMRALVAYIRHLSDGFRVYDTYCAACHGDDGQGVAADAARPMRGAVPPLHGRYGRRAIVHMLRRERGVMPHFRDLSESQLRDVVQYLRAVVLASPEPADARAR